MLDTRNRIEQTPRPTTAESIRPEASHRRPAGQPSTTGKGSPESVEAVASHLAAHNQSPTAAIPYAALSKPSRRPRQRGEHKYTEIKAPCLAIFAVPHDPNSDAILPTDPAHHAAALAADLERTTNLSNAFAAGVPSAQVVRLPNARHDVFNSNEAEVLRAMNDFLDQLPQP